MPRLLLENSRDVFNLDDVLIKDTGVQALTGVAVEEFVEEQVIPEIGVGLHHLAIAEAGAAVGLVAQK